MKKIAGFLLLLTFCNVTIAETIEKTFTFSAPEISQNGEFQEINFSNMLLTAESGNPALPYSAISFLLPPGHEAVNIEFVGGELVDLEGKFMLHPYQPSRPLSETKKQDFVINEKTYASEHYPESQLGGLSTEYLNGYGFAFSAFTPVVYNTANGDLSYYSSVKIIVTTKASKTADLTAKNLSSRAGVISRVKRLAQNPDYISNYSVKEISSSEQYELLILTVEAFENDFEDLRDIYLSRGIRSKVFTKEYITQNVSGQDVPDKIRNFIIQEYQESDIEFVLIGGDVEHIPYRGFYCYVQSGSGYSDYGIPADLYYSALDGNWNDNGDNKWGEPDEDDLLPDIAVARMPFSDLSELENLLNKTMSYQNSPVLGEFQKPFLAGENLYSGPDTWGKDYLDLIIGEHSDNGYTTVGIPDAYSYETMYEYDASWGGSDLINKVNEGKQFVHHVGHANTTYVAHLGIGDITNANFYAANGVDHNFTILQTHGCDCGSFDANDCILEKMVNIENFAVAVIGNSRYGWFNEGQTEGPAAHLHREMVDAMFNDKIASIGKAFLESKIQTAPWVEAPGQWEEGALRWNFYDINVLGDPAMNIWNDEPYDLDIDYPEQVSLGSSSVEVTITLDNNPMENYTCVIMQDGNLLSVGLSDENGVANLNFDTPIDQPGEASLIVSGYNCLPDTNQIMFIVAGEPYVIYAESIADDDNGNQNGQIDFGENIMLDLSIENVGEQDAVDVNSVLSTTSEWVSLSDDTEPYGDIAIEETVMKYQAFDFDVASNVPDQTEMQFQLMASDGNSEWYSEFSLIANAPVLASTSMLIDDTENGDGNGIIDPGESFVISVIVSNDGHSDCESAVALLETTSDYITIDNASIEMGDMDIAATFICDFSASADEYVPQGTPVDFILSLNTGEYEFESTYNQTIGLLMEDFETGDFSTFDWISSGDLSWIIDDEIYYDGSYSSKSGSISDSESSNLMIQLEVGTEGDLSFFRKVSSEQDWDYLEFYIDGILLDEWSGEQDWEEVSYPIDMGTHILKWSYTKDSYYSSGSDCAWLDNIIFPSSATILAVKESVTDLGFSVFPNPSQGIINIKSNRNFIDSEIYVFDLSGRMVSSKIIKSNLSQISVDLNNLNNGIYFIELRNSAGIFTEKIIIKR
ncbi:MAG: hypothetical protein C0598_01535 [Marinilabiliales bacterium]|nr:MAG: hypothetical protein C0598_01535 [Marinilabiliales bacterium]